MCEGGQPASAAHPDKDRSTDLELEAGASAKSNNIQFRERAKPSVNHLQIKEGGRDER